MKNLTKFFVATFLLLSVASNVFAYDFSAVCSSGQTLYYETTSSTTVKVIKNNSRPVVGNLVIPGSVTYTDDDNIIHTYSVTSIGDGAFQNCSGLTSITIPNSVTSIGIYAFSNCSGLIGDLTIPNSVTNIGENTFHNCSGLTSVTIPNSVTSIEDYAFCSCSGLTSVTIGNSITSIGERAFGYCSGLTSVTIPNSVTSIGEYAFRECSGLGTINFNATNCTYMGGYYPAFYNSDANATINIGTNVTTIPNYAFIGILGSGNLTIPNSVTYIGESAFSGCSGLTGTLTISNSVTSISESAFRNCSGLTGDLTIPNSVTSIGENAFTSCSGLTSITIPNSVTSIEQYAFSGCSGVTSLTIGNAVTSIGRGAFSGCSGLLTVNFNATNCTSMGHYYDDYYGDDYYPVFQGCSALATLNIGENVTNIPDDAFHGCGGLTSVTLPESIASIGAGAFYNCGMTSVTIPNSVTSIGGGAFYGCSGLTSVTIGNSVTSIGDYAFAYCSGLTSVTIGESITSIGLDAFYTCPITVVNYTGSIAQWCGISFGSDYSNPLHNAANLYINNSLVTDLVIPNTVTEIKAYAFQGATCLTSVTIPESVTSIGRYAFWNCSGLTDIYANPTTPPTIVATSNYSTFNNYTATLWVPCGSATAYSSANGWGNFSDIREMLPYTLNVASADLTMGTASVTQQPTCTDATAIITATPNEGCVFVQWNGGNTDNPRTITVTSNAEYTAYFGHNITVVSADETMGTVSGGGTYPNGEQVEISAVANEHYHFVQWNDGNTDNPRTITVTGNATYTATFAIDQFSITVESDNINFGNVSGSGTYGYGSEIQISATPAEHHHFTQWNDGNTDNPRTITVTSDSTFTASFAIDQHTVTVESADTEMGTVSEGGTYDYGNEIQISATPAEGYGFATWNDGNTDNPRTVTVTEDITYTATFGAWRTITVLSADETMGIVSGGGVYVEGAQVEISAEAVEHYHFAQWNDGNTDNPRTITVTGDATYTASFAIDRFTITVESADEAMGTVSESNTYDYGTEIQISATAAEHYHFVQWNDGNTDNPRTITVTEDATYRASFAAESFTITVVSDDEAMGTVSEGGTFPYGTEIQIYATPRDTYIYGFVGWNDGNTDNPRTITVVADAEYIAYFISLTGIDESAVSEIALFPNPATDILNITSSETISEVEIVNVMGQVVKRFEVNSDNVVCDVEELKAGVYVVRIHTEGTVVSQRKFVKE